MICSGYVWIAFSAAQWLRRNAVSGGAPHPIEVFSRCTIASYFPEMFVRGAGYFTATGLLLAFGVWLLHYKKTAKSITPNYNGAPRSQTISRS